MKKSLGIIVVVLVLAVAGFAGAAYWSGQQAERWYQDALAQGSNNPNVKLSTARYQRGLFSSQIETRVQFVLPENHDPDQPDPSFTIRQEVYHGPVPLAGRGAPGVPMQWTGAVVRATLDPNSSAWTRELAQWYGNQEPVVAISRVGFDGASDTSIAMPPLNLAQVGDLQSLKFSGLQGQFRIAPHSAAIEGGMSAASLEVTGQPTEAGADRPADADQLSLRDLTVTVNQRKGAFDLMFGESRFNIGELRGENRQAGGPFAIDNLSVIGKLSQPTPRQVAAEAVFKADKVTVDQQSGAGSVRLALGNLDGSTVARFEQWQQKTAGKLDDPQALDDLLDLVKALLRGKPEFVLDTQATLTQGEWRSKLTLNFQDPGAINPAQDPMSLLGSLEKGLADITASKLLVETVLKDLAKADLQAQVEEQGQEAGEQAVQAMAEQQVAQQLQGLTAAGFIRLSGDQYRSTARFEGGKLFVNDQEIPLASAVAEDDASGLEAMPLEPDDGVQEEEPPLEPDSGPGEPAQEKPTQQ
ncbi:MAG: YdgA family protein [Candidatus Competibacter sp.]|nr:YdgA family protein [Candidatus Competibacter sp.]MDG4583286.1 YdgA family protein [Candidatus Competibacter sp.]